MKPRRILHKNLGSPGGCLAVGIGVLMILAGSRWIYVMALTNYRAHLRPTLLPLGGLFVLIGALLILWAKGRRAE